ncbi:alkaline-phosphatase-like protein [Globomyces pollinis-pini]|nr:alkaline-phosphatase-like protein [Globomyces pollinis-pini]
MFKAPPQESCVTLDVDDQHIEIEQRELLGVEPRQEEIIEEAESLLPSNHQLSEKKSSRATVLSWCIATILTLLVVVAGLTRSSEEKQLVVLISLDGCRPEYLTRGLTPTLSKWAKNGVSANMLPAFPSITFPNHYSLVTGLYPESHGIVGNVFYDKKLDDLFVYYNTTINSKSKWWNGEPIWITGEMQGLITGTAFWPGSEAKHNGLRATYWKKYNASTTIDEQLDWVYEWLEKPIEQRPSFLAIYISEIDHSGHLEGPDSKLVNDSLVNVDSKLQALYEGMEKRRMLPQTTFVVVSDHGMAATDLKKVIFLDDYVPEKKFTTIVNGPMFYIYPYDVSETNAIYEVFSKAAHKTGHFKVWKKEDIPESFHYNNDRVGPIVMVPELSWSFAMRSSFDPSNPPFPKGVHGYDEHNDEMKAIFIASGNMIRKSTDAVLDMFKNVEVYGLLTKLLDLEPAPNNGTAKWLSKFEKHWIQQ